MGLRQLYIFKKKFCAVIDFWTQSLTLKVDPRAESAIETFQW